MTKIYIVHETYGDGEFVINKIFFDESKAKTLLFELRVKELKYGEEIMAERKRLGRQYGPPYWNKTKYDIEEYEVE